MLKIDGINDVVPYPERSLFFISNNHGKVMVFMIDYEADRSIPFGFTLLDECDFLENPHGSLIDSSQEQRAIT